MKKNIHISHHFPTILMIVFVSVAAAIFLKINNNGTNAFVPVINTLGPYSDNNKSQPSNYMNANITINGFNLAADVPITKDQFEKGLDIKDYIYENQAMLFIFKEPNKVPFWMH